MATPMVSDVFKFFAIRSPQPVTEQQATRTFVRDGRATTQAGVQELKRIARKLLQPEAALAAWLNSTSRRLTCWLTGTSN